ncbi:MAG: hypothetical protein GY950_05345 [bacterium]|nr:hypothetical protein [bacterium]
MKQKKINKKLVLNKQTIAHLSRSRMKGVKGGSWPIICPVTIEDRCWTKVVQWCISDPPTGCLGCPQSEINPDKCPEPVDPVPIG